MPKVNKHDLLQVVRELWGTTGEVEDEGKMHLAVHLIDEAWNAHNKEGVTLNIAGQIIRDALGGRWLSSQERAAAGKPALRHLLAEDPYFVMRTDTGGPHPIVKLRVSRLSKLIGNPDLIASYRAPALVGSSSSAVLSQQQAAAQAQAGGLALSDQGLPIRPGVSSCPHYLKFGWCLFKAECWYSHPPSSGVHAARATAQKVAASASNGSQAAGEGGEYTVESELEPGVMLLNGAYPIRPGARPCGFYIENGWCGHKAKCRLHHPPRRELAIGGGGGGLAGAGGSADLFHTAPGGRGAAASPDNNNGGGSPTVRQPPLQVLLGVVIDSVWPPRASPEAATRGAVAKYVVNACLAEVTRRLPDKEAEVTVPGAQAGIALNKFWREQGLYDPLTKPWAKAGMAALLGEDPLFHAHSPSGGLPTITLRLGRLITMGAQAASKSLGAIADAVWPPHSGKDSWLRGTLAKWLLQAGFEGGGGEVLRQVLTVGPNSPTVFRIDVAQAGEYLVRCWGSQPHPYDASAKPYTQLKPLIAEDRFFHVEAAPGKPNSQHVTLDLLDMLRELPRIARASYNQEAPAGVGAGSSSAAAGPSARFDPAAAGSSRAAAAATGQQQQQQGGPTDELLFAEAVEEQAAANPFGAMLQASAAAGAFDSNNRAGAGSSSSGGAAAASDPVADAQADIAALEGLRCSPPPTGAGPGHMRRWWPPGAPEPQGFVWAEIAVRLLSPDDPEATMRVAEMVQHLEICPVLAVGCAYYAGRPHLLQFFAPFASIGGLELPAAVYLMDVLSPSRDVRNFLALVAPVLSSTDNIKVCHSSRQWSGLLERGHGMRLSHYLDTQQTNYVLRSLQRELGRRSLSDAELQRTAEVSLSGLLSAAGLYHPVRHAENAKAKVIQWQERPLSDELITAAAADVAYLIPLMEGMVRQVRSLAADYQKAQAGARGRLGGGLPPELGDSSVLATLAGGVEGQQRGGLSYARLGQWASLSTFHQAPVN